VLLKDSIVGKIFSMAWEIPVANAWMSWFIYMKSCYENNMCVGNASDGVLITRKHVDWWRIEERKKTTRFQGPLC
jgi:hypothetical protein